MVAAGRPRQRGAGGTGSLGTYGREMSRVDADLTADKSLLGPSRARTSPQPSHQTVTSQKGTLKLPPCPLSPHIQKCALPPAWRETRTQLRHPVPWAAR